MTELHQTSGWNGDNLLSILLLNPVGEHTPRPLRGEVPARRIGRVLTVSLDETIPRVFRKLASEGFLGCPVMDGNNYVGFITMMDLVRATNSLFWSDVEAEWVEFFDKKEEFANCSVRDIMDIPTTLFRDPHPPIREDFTTFYALEKMVRESLHRLPIVSSTTQQRLSGIITQSMLISHLRQIKEAWGEFGQQLVASFIYDLNRNVISVKEDETAINAFNMMEDNNVSGLAVLDKDGTLVGAISIRDLRGVGASGSKFFRLFRSVKDFKQLSDQEYDQLTPKTHWSTAPVPTKPVFVTSSNTVEDVLEKMEDGNLHRVFVCDEASVAANQPRVIGVISQRDVLRLAMLWAINECQPGKIQPEGAMGLHAIKKTAKKEEEEEKVPEKLEAKAETIAPKESKGRIDIPIL